MSVHHDEDVRISPFYHEAKNEITRPTHFVACSRYFVEKWMPQLGGTGTQLVLFLRSQGYYNPQTGECRDGVQVGMKKIAQACGCSKRTIQREIENNEALKQFVRVESCYVQEDGHIRRLENVYRIAMDDPLHPDDKPRLRQIVQERENKTGKGTPRQRPELGTPAKAETRRRDHALQKQAPPPKAEERIAPNSSSEKEGHSKNPVSDNLSLPSCQFVTTPATNCHHPSDKLSQHNNIPSYTEDIHNNNSAQANNNASNSPNANVVAPSSIESLCKKGISRHVAEELANKYGHDTIRQQIEALPYRNPKDPAAVLVKAIRESWALPEAYQKELERQEANRRAREKEAARMRAEEERRRQEEERKRCIEEYWEALSEEERLGVEEAAIQTLRRDYPFLASRWRLRPNGTIVQATLAGIRQNILAEQLGLPSA